MGRLGIPSELIGTLLWLIDDEASGFVTGITVPVDGGFRRIRVSDRERVYGTAYDSGQ